MEDKYLQKHVKERYLTQMLYEMGSPTYKSLYGHIPRRITDEVTTQTADYVLVVELEILDDLPIKTFITKLSRGRTRDASSGYVLIPHLINRILGLKPKDIISLKTKRWWAIPKEEW